MGVFLEYAWWWWWWWIRGYVGSVCACVVVKGSNVCYVQIGRGSCEMLLLLVVVVVVGEGSIGSVWAESRRCGTCPSPSLHHHYSRAPQNTQTSSKTTERTHALIRCRCTSEGTRAHTQTNSSFSSFSSSGGGGVPVSPPGTASHRCPARPPYCRSRAARP
jgi:hypothetical protein